MHRQPIETRCRFDNDGVTVCHEITDRLTAIAQAEQLELPTVGLEKAIDNHLRGLWLHDEAGR